VTLFHLNCKVISSGFLWIAKVSRPSNNTRHLSQPDAPRNDLRQPFTAVQTKSLRLSKPVPLGHRINGWRVCWVGVWDRCRVFFVVMVEAPVAPQNNPLRTG
jgi:hypothetical protein